MNRRILVPIVLTAFALVLGACASIPDTSMQNLQGPPPTDQGLVVVEVINNNRRITSALDQWTEVILYKLDAVEGEEKTFGITSLGARVGARAYVGMLPPGRYVVGALYAIQRGDITYSASAPMPLGLGHFVVEPSTITDLGTIVYNPLETKAWTDEELPAFSVTRTSNDHLLKSLQSDKPEWFHEGMHVLSWASDQAESLRIEAASNIVNGAYSGRAFRLRNGQVILAGKLGMIRQQTASGWRAMRIPTHREVLSFTELADGSWLAGGEYGLLASKRPEQSEWNMIRVSDPLAHLIDVGTTARGQTYLVLMRDKEVSFELVDDDLTTVVASRKWPIKTSFWGGVAALPFVISAADDHLDVYIGSNRARYSYASDDWQNASATRFNWIKSQGNNLTVGIPFSSWDGAKPLQYTSDHGETWTSTTEKANIFGSWDNAPYISRQHVLYRPGNSDSYNFFTGWKQRESAEFQTSTDNGASWSATSQIDPGCQQIVHRASIDTEFVLLCDNGDLLLSTDQGMAWQTAFQRQVAPADQYHPAFLVLRKGSATERHAAPPPIPTGSQ